MAGFIEDVLLIDSSSLFIVSVCVAIVLVMFTAFYYDYRNRKQLHRKEVNLKQDEDISSEESSAGTGSESDSDGEDSDKDEILVDKQASGDVDKNAEPAEEDIVGLLGQLKNARLKQIEETLTEEQLKSEKEIQQEQLQAIFELLRQQENDLDINPMNEDDLKAQLNMYR